MLIAFSFSVSVLTFVSGSIALSWFFATYDFVKLDGFASRAFSWLRFFGILVVLPFYALLRMLLLLKGKSLKPKLGVICSSLFIFVIFLPLWLFHIFVLTFTVAYFVGNRVGVAPIIENISGTGSMYPTFPKGTGATDRENSQQTVASVVFWKYPMGYELFGKQYFTHALERGDIVSFSNKTTQEITIKQYGEESGFVKRVIGVPGDVLELRDGIVYVNNHPLKEQYTASPRSTFAEGFLQECRQLTIPVGNVFVMGDNRKGSSDSRDFGLVPEKDISSVLPLSFQEGKWDKNWRDTSLDLDASSKITLETQKYLELLNEKRQAAGVPLLRYQPKLETSARERAKVMLRFNDLSFEASRSGYTMSDAMSDVGYFNPVYGESPAQGYYTAEELIENQFAFPESSEFLLEKDYDDLGIAIVQGEINGCPTQIVVQHFAGYVPPDYTQEDIASWREALGNLRQIQPGWSDLKNNSDFYFKHTLDVDRINELISRRIENISKILSRMEKNEWLTTAEQGLVDGDKALAEEINSLATKLNEAN